MLDLDPRTTALVLIDLQNWTLGMPMGPHDAATVTANAARLAAAVKAGGGVVLPVRIGFAPDLGDMLKVPVDAGMRLPEGGIPAGALDFPPEVAALPMDAIITKHQWSAFHGTDLDVQLRRRGITTIVLGGVMTNFGVEGTARDAWQHSYAVVLAEDASSAPDEAMHQFSITRILPRVSRIRTTAEIVAALEAGARG
jgi:nicotinamidase-related amidase